MSYSRFSDNNDFYIWCGIKFHCIYGKKDQENDEKVFDSFQELQEFVKLKISEGYLISEYSKKLLEINSTEVLL